MILKITLIIALSLIGLGLKTSKKPVVYLGYIALSYAMFLGGIINNASFIYLCILAVNCFAATYGMLHPIVLKCVNKNKEEKNRIKRETRNFV